ncbi:MAG: hypothetical protein ING68_03940 [Rhodocyclaceae bacterium]|nr:hypothetical protein [Rhodocyclaceae bacterium]MCA3021304.1 hypothetical protein [Rhodocyclaceae bacterium]MCA3054373.1 hypothetical protein [Rhodocyclaceae bacterium]
MAAEALKKLLQRAENAFGNRSAERVVAIRFSNESLPRYARIETHADKQSCHGDLQLAQRAGAIKIEWERAAGDANHIHRIVLTDGSVLAHFLGIVPRWQSVALAADLFAGRETAYPVLKRVLEIWRSGAKVRATGPEEASVWDEAVRIVEHCSSQNRVEMPVRRLSAQFSGDSKRIERLAPIIDVLVQGDVAAPSRDPEDVFNEIGLVKFPPTLLIAGAVEVTADGRMVSVESGYLGFPPSGITKFSCAAGVTALLTVENLTTFHELVSKRRDSPGTILLYTGGMPSPSWKRVYRLLLNSISKETRIFHWGDIDAGGFRIADHLADCADDAGRRLELHSVFPEPLSESFTPARRVLTDIEVATIEKICVRRNWGESRSWVLHHRVAVEQESLVLTWPELVLD